VRVAAALLQLCQLFVHHAGGYGQEVTFLDHQRLTFPAQNKSQEFLRDWIERLTGQGAPAPLRISATYSSF